MLLPIRVLIIEDDENDVRLISQELRRGGFEPDYLQVYTTEAMSSALLEKTWDIILSCSSSSNVDTPAALTILNQTQLNIPIIVISNNAEHTLVNEHVNKHQLSRLSPLVRQALKKIKNKNAPQTTEKNTEDLWKILNQSQNEIYFFDAETLRFKTVNQGAINNTGYTFDEMLEKHPYDLINAISRQNFLAFIQPLKNNEVELLHIETIIKRKNGTRYPADVHLQYSENNNQPVFYAILIDISDRKKAQEYIHKLAYYDSLTYLPNRRHMQEKLHALVKQSKHRQQNISLLYIDLDRFKTINESLGQAAGDEALIVTANRLAKITPDNAWVGRMVGDEFLIVLDNQIIENEEHQLIKIIKHAISEPLKLNAQEVYLSGTIGISHFPNDATNMDSLVKYAETATKRAKINGSGFELYSSELEVYTAERISLESSLRKALERNEFILHYQPQFDLNSKKITGMEALLRWQDPVNGLISPAEFIPLLEQTGLIKQVGDWVLHQACTQSMAWQALGINVPRVAINLSAKQFSQKNLHHIVTNIIEDTGINPKLVELEVTESAIMHQLDQVIFILRNLHDKGIHISIDDFGTGYSSLSYLKHFPIDVLKIDRSFVAEIPNNKADIAIANTIISMGHNLNLKVIAEGVETEEQGQCLAKMGCDWAQGYHYSRPLSVEQCFEFLKKYR